MTAAPTDEPDPQRFDTFEELHKAMQQNIWRYARRRVPSDTDADDITQDTFLKAYAAFERIAIHPAPCAYVYTIARNCAEDLQRARLRQPAISIDENSDGEPATDVAETGSIGANPADLAAEMLPEATRAHVRDCLDRLDEARRTAVVLVLVEGLSSNEVAAMMDKTGGAIRNLVMRARQQLTACLHRKNVHFPTDPQDGQP